MSSTPPLPNSARDLRLLKALEAEREQRRARNRLAAYRPYIKQREFHDAGATHRERLFLAGNQLGKTLAGSFEVAMHLTGLYPEWWKGRRWDRPIVAWAAGVTGESTRDNPQRLLLGRSGQFGTGAIPAAATIATTRAAGIADLVDTARIAHISGGESLLAFKSYEKGREKWQGETLDLVWFDEEPPRDIYSEGLTRTNATGGCVFLTCTPLLGMTEVIGRFLQAPTPDRHVTQMTIDDADHYTAEERARIVAGYAPHEREARAKGIPMLGSGRIFPLPEDSIACDAIPLAAHWPRIGGMDFGWDHPFAAVELAHDRDTDTVYVTKAYRVREATPLVHAAALKPWGAWLPWAWPADGLQHSKDSGKPLAEQYRAQGLNLLPYHARYPDNPDSTPGTSGVEAGLIDMLDRMQSSRLKVFRHLADWFEEFRLYHRDEGRIVKLQDDLMSATRYAIMCLRDAKKKPSGQGFGRKIEYPDHGVA
ncbi:MAG TPA: terminase family protein [Alphaproteobacteria bacterium]|nr:terminase family protein [Alphaproteobacteria bacterium]